MSQPAPSNDPARFVEQFTAAWAHPRVDNFVDLLHEDVRLVQPLTPAVNGRAAARAEFTRLLQWLPDINGTVDHWAAAGPRIFIEWRLRASFGARPTEWPIVDRILLEPRLRPPQLEQVEARCRELDLSGGEDLPEELLTFYHPETLTQLCALRRTLQDGDAAAGLDEVDAWIRMVACLPQVFSS